MWGKSIGFSNLVNSYVSSYILVWSSQFHTSSCLFCLFVFCLFVCFLLGFFFLGGRVSLFSILCVVGNVSTHLVWGCVGCQNNRLRGDIVSSLLITGWHLSKWIKFVLQQNYYWYWVKMFKCDQVELKYVLYFIKHLAKLFVYVF